MSDIFKKIGDTLSDAGKTVGEKTKQAGTVAKLNAKIISSERSISESYSILGKYYYDTYKNNPDEEIAETVNAVTAAVETIAQLKSEILALKGLVKCTKCGGECPVEDTFCGKCGAELEKPEPAPAEEEVEDFEETEEVEAPNIVIVEDADKTDSAE
ncbi:MAG: zinc ribbon domain-containing protein [Oscillospiraceae bacterium]|nr:zinc ribbon domain-containing protein [Oscillospiraceae bacterium]